MRVLVTGGAGFIGSHIARRMVQIGHDVTVLDDFSSGHWSNLVDFDGDVITGDLASPVVAGRMEPAAFDFVYHEASITDTTVHDMSKMMTNNVEAFRNLLHLCTRWKSRLIWASSASTYGRNEAPNTETQTPDPLNVYAFSKLQMERLVKRWSGQLSQPPIGLRYFNVYGPGEDHKGKFASMIHQLAKQMRSGNRPRLFTPGDQRRDFVYVEDVVEANLAAMTAKTPGVFNVGCGIAASFNEVVTQLNRVLKTDLQPEYFENPFSFTQDFTQADLRLSRQGLAWQPRFDIGRGIEAYAASGRLGIGLR